MQCAWLVILKALTVLIFLFNETAVGPTQTSSEDYTESGEEIEEDQTGLGGQKKRKTVRSIKKSNIGKKEEQLLRDDGEGDESIEEEEDKVDKLRKAADLRDKEERQRGKSKGVNSLVGECREEKAPYVTVTEAKVVTLANKVSTACIVRFCRWHLR